MSSILNRITNISSVGISAVTSLYSWSLSYANGEARLDVSTFNPNVYYATVYFEGDNDYNPAVKEDVKVYIKKITTVLTAPDVVAVQDNGDNLVVTLNDKNGNACSNLWVYITIDGVTSSLKTGADGQVKLSTDGLSIGNYTAEIKFKGTTYYYSSSTTANVTITE